MAIIYKAAGERYGAVEKNVPILTVCGLFNDVVRLKFDELVVEGGSFGPDQEYLEKISPYRVKVVL